MATGQRAGVFVLEGRGRGELRGWDLNQGQGQAHMDGEEVIEIDQERVGQFGSSRPDGDGERIALRCE